MASAWGSSWSVYWGNSWGSVSTPSTSTGATGGAFTKRPDRKRWARIEDLLTPEQLAVELQILDERLARVKDNKSRKKQNEAAQLQARIDELRREEEEMDDEEVAFLLMH